MKHEEAGINHAGVDQVAVYINYVAVYLNFVPVYPDHEITEHTQCISTMHRWNTPRYISLMYQYSLP